MSDDLVSFGSEDDSTSETWPLLTVAEQTGADGYCYVGWFITPGEHGPFVDERTAVKWAHHSEWQGTFEITRRCAFEPFSFLVVDVESRIDLSEGEN